MLKPVNQRQRISTCATGAAMAIAPFRGIAQVDGKRSVRTVGTVAAEDTRKPMLADRPIRRFKSETCENLLSRCRFGQRIHFGAGKVSRFHTRSTGRLVAEQNTLGDEASQTELASDYAAKLPVVGRVQRNEMTYPPPRFASPAAGTVVCCCDWERSGRSDC